MTLYVGVSFEYKAKEVWEFLEDLIDNTSEWEMLREALSLGF